MKYTESTQILADMSLDEISLQQSEQCVLHDDCAHCGYADVCHKPLRDWPKSITIVIEGKK